MHQINSTKKNTLYVIFLFILLEIIVYISVIYINSADHSQQLQNSANSFRKEFSISTNNLSELSRILYDSKIDTHAMIDIMSKASQTQDSDELDLLRKNLYRKLLPSYMYMKTHHIRQLHFHLPQTVSFLRFHKPNKYGDSLLGVRSSLEYVNKNKVSVSCFEEGRIFNGFRNVYPIFKYKKFVGTVEVSYSFEALQKNMLSVDPSSLLFVLDANVIDAKLFEKEKKNYKKSDFVGFEYDKASLNNEMQIPMQNLYEINREISKEVTPRLHNSETFSIFYENKKLYKKKKVAISFIPIFNINKKRVAYTIHYKLVDIRDLLWYKSRMIFFVLSFFALLVSILVGSYLRYQQKKIMR